MQLIATLISPLRIVMPRVKTKDKAFILNLNNYRNAHYQILNQTKVLYKDLMKEQINKLPNLDKIRVRYRLFPKTKRRTDIHNVCSIHEKYFADALVESKKLPDDDYHHYLESSYIFGEIDKFNPRVEIEIWIK